MFSQSVWQKMLEEVPGSEGATHWRFEPWGPRNVRTPVVWSLMVSHPRLSFLPWKTMDSVMGHGYHTFYLSDLLLRSAARPRMQVGLQDHVDFSSSTRPVRQAWAVAMFHVTERVIREHKSQIVLDPSWMRWLRIWPHHTRELSLLALASLPPCSQAASFVLALLEEGGCLTEA
jgi:hypothetical protein